VHTAGKKNLSTGTRFKQVILKGFLRLDIQPVQLISPTSITNKKIHQPSNGITIVILRVIEQSCSSVDLAFYIYVTAKWVTANVSTSPHGESLCYQRLTYIQFTAVTSTERFVTLVITSATNRPRHCRTPEFYRTRCLRAKLSILQWVTHRTRAPLISRTSSVPNTIVVAVDIELGARVPPDGLRLTADCYAVLRTAHWGDCLSKIGRTI
jgi:hypothetical protein